MIRKETQKSKQRNAAGGVTNRGDSILLRLDAIRTERGHKSFVVGITSSDRRVGVSTIAGNLAVRAASMNMGRVLLVDCNLDHPRQDRNFSLQAKGGLYDLIQGDVEAADVVANGKADGLYVLGAGKLDQRILAPDQVDQVMRSLRGDYDLIILDLPTVKNSARSIIFNRFVDGAVLVLDAQKSRARDARTAMRILEENGVEVIGTILNRAKRTLPGWLDRWI